RGPPPRLRLVGEPPPRSLERPALHERWVGVLDDDPMFRRDVVPLEAHPLPLLVAHLARLEHDPPEVRLAAEAAPQDRPGPLAARCATARGRPVPRVARVVVEWARCLGAIRVGRAG